MIPISTNRLDVSINRRFRFRRLREFSSGTVPNLSDKPFALLKFADRWMGTSGVAQLQRLLWCVGEHLRRLSGDCTSGNHFSDRILWSCNGAGTDHLPSCPNSAIVELALFYPAFLRLALVCLHHIWDNVTSFIAARFALIDLSLCRVWVDYVFNPESRTNYTGCQ